MALDKEWRSSCVTVLYKSDDDRMVFPRIQFDQVDHKHIYIALRNQIRRVAVTQCDVYKTLRDCRASQDPFCGWCVNTSMCSTNDECSDSSWISIPEASFEKNLITFHTRENSTMPKISSLEPSHVSFHGRNNAVIKGKNLRLVEKIRFQGFMECAVTETKVLDGSSDTLLKFNIPKGNKGNAKVCVVTADGQCHSSATITYGSAATCTRLQPTVSWASGGRMIEVLGTSLKSVDKIIVNKKESRIRSSQRSEEMWFYTPPLLMDYGYFSVSLRVGESSVVCADKLSYLPDPEFISFSTSLDFNDVQVFINKKADRLDMREEEVKVWGLQEDKQFECLVEKVISTAVVCNILGTQEFSIDVDSLRISVGYFSTVLRTRIGNTHRLFCVKELP